MCVSVERVDAMAPFVVLPAFSVPATAAQSGDVDRACLSRAFGGAITALGVHKAPPKTRVLYARGM